MHQFIAKPGSKLTVLLSLLMLCLYSGLAIAIPGFSKAFTPNTIGPGSITTLSFYISNIDPAPVTDLAFTDSLPMGVFIATPANATNDCTDGVVTAPDGRSTITFNNGKLGIGESCTVSVNVTSSTIGTHNNISSTLSSSVGSSEAAIADLTVNDNLPGFSKSFAPSTIPRGNRSTLTFTLDNTANASAVTSFLSFTDTLPIGIEIASPANTSTTCGGTSNTITATPGTSEISFSAFGFDFAGLRIIPAGSACTITVDVTGTANGILNNITEDLNTSSGISGKASATLEVTTTQIALQKSFINDPVAPGANVELEFIISNFDRLDAATGITFSDDLGVTLSGLTFSSLVSNDCGGSVAGLGTTSISFSSGVLAAGGSCTIRTNLTVPAASMSAIYSNSTTAITADINGLMVIGNSATDDLFVSPAPILTKEFIGDPVNPGDDIILRFTIDNTSATSAATDIAFDDVLTTFLSFPVTAVLPATPCGAGSTLVLTIPDTDKHALSLTRGSLAVAGSCTFDVTLTLPGAMPSGVYTNTTQTITATVDGESVTGNPATDDFTVIAAPSLSKAFTDDPVEPGGTVTLEFTLTHSPDAASNATDITFTDDLATVLAGLTAILPVTPDPPCGAGSTLTGSAGDTLLTLTGGTLTPGESCTFSVSLDVPAGTASGDYPNTSSGVSATVNSVTVTSAAASDALRIAGVTFSKEFIGDPVTSGGTVTLSFSIANTSATDDATGIVFTDNLSNVISGLTATGLPISNICGMGSTLTGTSLLVFTGGNLIAGDSCTFDITLDVPSGTADGSYNNVTSSLFATLDGSQATLEPATDTLIVNSNLLQLTKEFTNDPVSPGSSSTNLHFSLMNLDATQTATNITFTDDLDAALTGLTAMGLPVTVCGGTLAGTSTLSFSGGSLAPSVECQFDVTVNIPAAATPNTYTNTSSTVTGAINGLTVSGDATSDDLVIIELLSFSKSFDAPSSATGTPALTFTITNPGTNSVAGLSFSDELNDVITGLIATNLPLTDICGSGSSLSLSGSSLIQFTGGNLPPSGGTCSFDIDLLVPATAAVGSYINTTSELSQSGLLVASPATAMLSIEPAPGFSKAFTPASIGLAQTSTLSLTIDNTASAIAANVLDFTDNLPAGMLVTTPAVISNTCSGTVTAVAGNNLISLTGGAVASGTSCQIDVDVTGNSAGSLRNTTNDLNSSSGNSGTASSTLTVNPQPGFSKAFAPSVIALEGISSLSFTVDNSSSTVTANSLNFVDTLPSDVFVATPSNILISCTGGTVTATSDTNMISYTGGSVSAASSCTLSVDVTSSVAGAHLNTTGDFSSSLGNSGGSSDTLAVVPAPAFAKSFSPSSIGLGQGSILSFSVDNTASSLAASALDFTDNLPAGMLIASSPSPSNTCGGTLTAIAGSSVISLSGATAAANNSCQVQVSVLGNNTGTLVNTSGNLTSSLGNSGTASSALTVNPLPGFSKSFAPALIPIAGISTLNFTITNSGSSISASSLNFTDNLPSGVTVASPANASTTCTGGTLTATAGSSTITYTGGSIAAAASCTLSVDITSSITGAYVNTSGDLSSSLGNSGNSSDTLTFVPAPLFTKNFSASSIGLGQTSTLSFSIDNTASLLAASTLGFTDNLPAGMLVASSPSISNTCGDTLTATAGTSVITLSGATVAASASCQIQVKVVGNSTGALINTSGNLSSNLGNSGTASDTLTVNPLPGFSKSFTPNLIPIAGISTLSFSITNSGSSISASSLNFTDNLPSGVIVASPANASTTCTGGTLTATAGSTAITYTGGNVVAAASCILSVDVTSSITGAHVNTSGDLSSSLGNSGNSSDTLTVVPAPLFAKNFSASSIGVGQTSTLSFSIDNTASLLAASTLGFTDNLPAGMLVASAPSTSNSCGGTLTATAGTSVITLSGATVAASASCQIQVNVVGNSTGALINTSGTLTSNLGNSGTASDTLTVNPLPGFSKSFTPTLIPIAGISTLNFTITNNGSSISASSLNFTDNLPSGVILASPANASSTCTGGTLTATAGSSTITYTGGSIAAAASCTLSVDVTSSITGAHVNTSGDLSSSLGNSGNSSDTLTVVPIPLFTKAFSPSSISLGQTSTLSFSINNSTSGLVASALSFTDNLPAGMLVASSPSISNTCGGTLTAAPGTSAITLSGATAAANASCQIQVSVIGNSEGALVNTTADLTSNLGNSGTASDTLIVGPQPGFSKSFSPTLIPMGSTSTLSFAIDNSRNTIPANNLDFIDNLPSGVIVASPANSSTTCTGGTLAAVSGGTSISYTDGSVTASASCTLSIDVTSNVAGAHLNTTGNLTSSLGNSGSSSDTLTVVPVPLFAKTFSPSTINLGQTSILSFSINNTASGLAASGLSFTDTFPAGMQVASPPSTSNTCGGTLTATPGAVAITLSGATVAVNASCLIQVSVIANSEGALVNTTADLTSSLGNSGTASDTLTVGTQLGFSMSFTPSKIPLGGFSILNFTIDNSASSLAATAIRFSNNLPSGILLAITPKSITNTCGGSLTAIPNTGYITLSGGTAASNSTCQVEVTVVATSLGTLVNTSGVLSSSRGNSGTTSDTLLVVPLLGFSMSFTPDLITSGNVSTLSFTIDNSSSSVPVTSLDFTNNLPSEITVASPDNVSSTCTGGIFTVDSATGIISYSGGSISASTSCTLSVDVTSAQAGAHNNTSGDLSSSLGNSGSASAILTVEPVSPAPPPPPVPPRPIPTLSQWAIIILSLIMLNISAQRIRCRK